MGSSSRTFTKSYYVTITKTENDTTLVIQRQCIHLHRNGLLVVTPGTSLQSIKAAASLATPVFEFAGDASAFEAEVAAAAAASTSSSSASASASASKEPSASKTTKNKKRKQSNNNNNNNHKNNKNDLCKLPIAKVSTTTAEADDIILYRCCGGGSIVDINSPENVLNIVSSSTSTSFSDDDARGYLVIIKDGYIPDNNL